MAGKASPGAAQRMAGGQRVVQEESFCFTSAQRLAWRGVLRRPGRNDATH
jgi:hypothetical protein